MIIKTRYLPATQSEGARMRATAVDMTATLTVAYPYSSNDPHTFVAEHLARAFGHSEVVRDDGTNVFTTGL